MEYSPFLLTLISSIIISIGIIVVILLVKIILNRLINYLEYITAITVGILLGIIFIGFIPELITNGNLTGKNIGIFILLGVFIFYILELLLHWHHCKDLNHNQSCSSSHKHEHKNGILMFGGTILHNIFHGIILFSAYSIDFYFGIATTIAVLLHSIPQNIVNYIMNHNNIKYVYIAVLGLIMGAFFTYPFSNILIEYKFYILAIIIGGLIYTSLSDIFPKFKGENNIFKKIIYFVFIIIGVALFILFEYLIDINHDH